MTGTEGLGMVEWPRMLGKRSCGFNFSTDGVILALDLEIYEEILKLAVPLKCKLFSEIAAVTMLTIPAHTRSRCASVRKICMARC